MMTFTKRSPITGNINSRDIDITEDQFQAWQDGEMIQVAMSNVSADDREFIISGMTPEDWATMFPEDE